LFMRSALCVLLLLLCGAQREPSARAQITEVDDLGRTTVLAHAARRVISLAPGITESLFALGAGDRVAGVTDFCNYPAEARTRTRVGGMVNPSIEVIVGLRPDLLVMSMEGNLRQDFSTFTSLNIPVFVTNPRDLEGIYRSLRSLARLTGTTKRADSLISSMRTRAKAAQSGLSGKKQQVLLFVSLQPLIAAGRNTFLHELLTLAGGENLAAVSPLSYPTFSREAVVAHDPDIMMVMSDVMADTEQLMKLFPEWATLRAPRLRRVYRVDADIFSRPGPRSIDALESLSLIIG
jgi:iron complex transport system substrate-binding protein